MVEFKKFHTEFIKFYINFTFSYYNEIIIINKNFRKSIKEWKLKNIEFNKRVLGLKRLKFVKLLLAEFLKWKFKYQFVYKNYRRGVQNLFDNYSDNVVKLKKEYFSKYAGFKRRIFRTS